ncbi:MAG: DUF3575 domain-containing protein [Bacteroidales bacterium]|nr:DUF3575 domain-containing protein [Bacteroidales bacterium]
MKGISNTVRLWGFIAALLLLGAVRASGQNYSVSTNAAEWLALGTANIQASVPLSRHTGIRSEAAFNPFTFGSGDSRKYFRRMEFSLGVRYWPWFVNSGWFLDGYADWTKYSLGGIFTSKSYEGYAYGLKMGGGYSLILEKGINLEMGWGGFLGIDSHTKYSCTKCGKSEGKSQRFIVSPTAILLGISFIF